MEVKVSFSLGLLAAVIFTLTTPREAPSSSSPVCTFGDQKYSVGSTIRTSNASVLRCTHPAIMIFDEGWPAPQWEESSDMSSTK